MKAGLFVFDVNYDNLNFRTGKTVCGIACAEWAWQKGHLLSLCLLSINMAQVDLKLQ